MSEKYRITLWQMIYLRVVYFIPASGGTGFILVDSEKTDPAKLRAAGRIAGDLP